MLKQVMCICALWMGGSIVARARDLPQGVPVDASIYAEAAVGTGQTCMAATVTDDDGLNEKPVVYLTEHAKDVVWHVALPLPKNTYQARATHCVGTPTTLYVLVQADTQPEQSLTQTLLEVVALQRETGTVVASRMIDVPDVSAAHTTWVDKGNGHFVDQDGHLVISGQYALLSNRDHAIKFSLEIPQDLTR